MATPPPNDDCNFPTPISGSGLFNFDLTNATTSPEGQLNCFTGAPGSSFEKDVWYCWTPDCSGLVTITTCGWTSVDTKIAYYIGCGCPDSIHTPFCCDDNSSGTCSPQSTINCEVACGQQYMIRIACAPGQSATAGPGKLNITCSGPPCNCDTCCGQRPNFLSDPNFNSTPFTGGVAIATEVSGISNHVVEMIDINSQPAPSGTNWFAPFYNPSGAQNWTRTALGSVFGVTIDSLGNVYLAHSSIYPGQSGFGDAIGTIAGAAAGAIYKIDTNNGTPSTFAVLPNNLINGCVGSECYPGLGNLCYSCTHQKLYVSNMEDGRVYRLDMNGAILSTWTHSTGVVLAGLPPPDPNGFPPLGPYSNSNSRGQRVWAVRVSRDRLYYSVWREDEGQSRQSALFSNEIWSIGLSPYTGDFLQGTETLELLMPQYGIIGGISYSNPVSDISFKPQSCCMLLAERTMVGDSTSAAHQSRLLEYCRQNGSGAWVPSGNNLTVGCATEPDSSAGGCDYDFNSGAGVNVNVWSTGDAIKCAVNERIYGLGGMTYAGTNPLLNGLMIDIDQSVAFGDKNQQGDVEITCPSASPPACQVSGDGQSCMFSCTTPGSACVPLEIKRDRSGHYSITRCCCATQCYLQFTSPTTPPVCANSCLALGSQCNLLARGNLDGTVTFNCQCQPPDAATCAAHLESDPDNPNYYYQACSGNCPAGQACYPSAIRESPQGSGHFEVADCACLPLVNPPCHPIVLNNQVICEGTCPTGGTCKIVRTVEQPGNSVLYHCECNCTPPPAVMTDWWPMDDNPAVPPINDIAGVFNNATLVNTGVFPVPSCVGAGLYFDGLNGYADVPDSSGSSDINFGTSSFTLEGWIQADPSNTNTHVILDKRVQSGGNVTGYSIFLIFGRLGIQLGSGPFFNYIWSNGPILNDGQCHFVAAVVTRGAPNVIKLFVDGASTTFTNSGLVSPDNTAPLTFGRRSLTLGADGYYRGSLDEWEFYRRALADTEIAALYNARQFGKCRESCYTSPVTFCKQQMTQSLCFQVCNYTGAPYAYNWNLSAPVGCIASSGTCNSAVTFTPSSGNTGIIAPGACKTVCVTLNRPSCLPDPLPVVVQGYQLVVNNTTTGNTFGCCNVFRASGQLCIPCSPNCNFAQINIGTTRQFLFQAANQGDTDAVAEYTVRMRHANTDSIDDHDFSLNGQTPGTPYTSVILIPAGQTLPIPVDATAVADESFDVLEITMEVDVDNDGLNDPVNPISVRTRIPCQTGAVGDMNEDGTTDVNDIPRFVNALLGAPQVAYDLVLADANCDGLDNGRDIAPMVHSLIAGP